MLQSEYNRKKNRCIRTFGEKNKKQEYQYSHLIAPKCIISLAKNAG